MSTTGSQDGPVSWSVSFAEVFNYAYVQKGASPTEADRILQALSKPTLQRYESAWHKFQGILGAQIRELAGNLPQELSSAAAWAWYILTSLPIWRLALWVKTFTQCTSLSQGRNLFSALILLPPCQQLRWETILQSTKRAWNVSKPKYTQFYDLEPLLRGLIQLGTPLSEEKLRERCILLLRFLCFFRGIDLARAKRSTIRDQSQPWFLETQRKGRKYFLHYPVPCMEPAAINPQAMLQRYILVTAFYPGDALILSLPNEQGERFPLKSSTINSLTRKWLRSKGLVGFTAHSTRGAAATSLLKRGVPPPLVQAMGDWESHDTFHKFYNRWAVGNTSLQCLLSPLSSAAQVHHRDTIQ